MSEKWSMHSLEPRRLLAGVTLLAHGFEGSIDDWVASTAAGIVDRLGGASAASVYTMTVDDTTGALAVTGFDADPGFGDYRSTSSAEAIIRLNWNAVSGQAYTTTEVAEVVTNYLLLPRTSNQLPALAQLPLHVVGHSRGASLVAEIARIAGSRGVIVDQTTFLDPHPIDGENDFLGADFGDPPMRITDNVLFADNYWRTDNDPNNLDFDGESVNGAREGDLNSSVQLDPVGTAHASVAAYYVGTAALDIPATTNGPIRSSWYDTAGGNPARDETGYFYSRVGGGARPLDGIGVALDGGAARSNAGQDGLQFPNLYDLKAKNGSTFAGGTNFNITFRGSDRDGQAAYEIYMDSDRNPYNGPGTLIAQSALGGEIDSYESSTTAGELAKGKYVLAAKIIDDDGQTRWNYGRTITITDPPPVGSLSNGVLTINGTSGDDVMRITESAGVLTAALGSLSSEYSVGDVLRIELFALEGNDDVSNSSAIVIYMDLGAGNDKAIGGQNDDTLTGGAGKNTLFGGAGNDRLNGSGSRDSLFGEGNDDRLYGNGGDDTLDGGGNVDRLFGGDGNDSLFGAGSNDKLYGELGDDTLFGGTGANILDGGDGTDTAQNRDGDTRVSIEVLL
jgi:Ca2+-binding RTX toxin-like protein